MSRKHNLQSVYTKSRTQKKAETIEKLNSSGLKLIKTDYLTINSCQSEASFEKIFNAFHHTP